MKGLQIQTEWDFAPEPLSGYPSSHQRRPGQKELLMPTVISAIIGPITEVVRARYWLGLGVDRPPMEMEVDFLFEDPGLVWKEFAVPLFDEYARSLGDRGPLFSGGKPVLFRPGVLSDWPQLVSAEDVHLLGYRANGDASALRIARRILGAAEGYFSVAGRTAEYLHAVEELVDIVVLAPGGGVWELFSNDASVITQVESRLKEMTKIECSRLGLRESWTFNG